MNRNGIIQRIASNLLEAGIINSDIRVQPDHFKPDAWRVAVIAAQFDGWSQEKRADITVKGLEAIDFQWFDLLTPEEVEWAGPLPSEQPPEDLPLWPEVLARGASGLLSRIRFPTDSDEDLEQPIVVTFYSLRGGVGRSTAMAYTAKLLAANGHKVICVDMDLEAPGLTSLFGIDEETIRLREDGQSLRGVVPLLVELDSGGNPDFAQHLVQVGRSESLFLLPAGVPDAEYARMLRLVTPDFWYKEKNNPLVDFFESLRINLPFRPSVILLDARTGLSEVSGPLLFGLSDMAIITFFPHPQAERGTRLLTRGVMNAKVRRPGRAEDLAPIPRFLVSPVPQSNAPEVKKRYRDRALEWIAFWLKDIQLGRQEQELEELHEEEVTHFVEYREDVATSDFILDPDKSKSPYGKLAEWIEGLLPRPSEERAENQVRVGKEDVLRHLSVASGTAENQGNLLQHFIVIKDVARAMDEEISLVLGRKGTGKTALFRVFKEDPKRKNNVIVVHAPQGLSNNPRWMMTYDGFKEIETILTASGAEWRHFWSFYCFTALCDFQKNNNKEYELFSGNVMPWESLSGFLEAFGQFVQRSRYGIIVSDELKKINHQLSSGLPCLLIVDGLDTGFGSASEELVRRKNAVEGLFSFIMEISSSLSHLKFKIFLREDIWRIINFQNKSHMFGKTVSLKWKDQADYLKVVIRQVVDVEAFRKFLGHASETARLINVPIDQWGDNDVYLVWNLMVGERMKGGNTAFTRNWIWSRLADANEDHTPRFLLQLFRYAIEWEKEEMKKNSYAKSIIRPRGLIECLSDVSRDAIASLREEFKELEELLNQLSSIAYTPIQKELLAGYENIIELAKEIGLLQTYEEDSKGNVVRYKVPDIYRLALGMTRKGQA